MAGLTKVEADRIMDGWLDQFANHRLAFVIEVLKATPEPWQEKVLRAMDEGAKRVSIASGHGVGKTTLLAWLVVHHLMTQFPQKTAITAPTAGQLWDALWPEIAKWLERLPSDLAKSYIPKAERIELTAAPSLSFATAKTASKDKPEALQGVHSDHVLLIADEGSGISDEVIDAAGGSLSGKDVRFVIAGNPLRAQGFFHDTHHRLRERWFAVNVSVFESRWADPEYAKDIELRYGKDSNHYRVRVLGAFPTSDDDAVIPFEWIETSIGREVAQVESAETIWGLDVAREGTHRTALAKRRGNVLLEPPKAWGGLRAAEVAGRVKAEWDITRVPLRPIAINIDVIGYGADVMDRLREMGLPARGVNVAETSSISSSNFRNLRAELWFKLRHWFEGRDVRLPVRDGAHVIEDLLEELSKATYKFQPQSGRILIAEKTGRRSPDLADALMLTMAGDAIAASRGRKKGSSRSRALGAPLKGLV